MYIREQLRSPGMRSVWKQRFFNQPTDARRCTTVREAMCDRPKARAAYVFDTSTNQCYVCRSCNSDRGQALLVELEEVEVESIPRGQEKYQRLEVLLALTSWLQ